MKRIFLVLALALALLSCAAVAFANASDRQIVVGARGDDVRMVQRLLADTGFYVGEIDGIFGNGTLWAVRDFQSYCGLDVSGVVDNETMSYLDRERSTSPNRYSRELTMTATAYTTQDVGSGLYTCRGHALRQGLVAVDPSVIPLGTRLFIPGYGYAIADDVGGAIKGHKIDLAFESRADALRFGRQRVTVYVLD